MRHLFITDLDGTLLGPDSRVSPESASIITSLSSRGALITVATARTPATVEPLLRDTFTSIPAIVLTGASMWDRAGHSYISPFTLSAQAANALEQRFLEYGLNPFVYMLSGSGPMTVMHAPVLSADEERFYAERKGLELKRFLFKPSPQCSLDSSEGLTILMLGIGATPTVQSLARVLTADEGLSVSAYPDIFDDRRSYIEVFRSGVSKAAAVLRLKSMLQADRVTVYGDHLNDLSMFAVADESVAVANALPQVIGAATRTIGPNTEPSVAADMAEQYERNILSD